MYRVLCFLTFLCLLSIALCEDKPTFFYFAYGSNLLMKRLHIQNPTAIFYSIVKLEHHRLDFSSFSIPWQGSPATIVEDDSTYIWGSVWTLDLDQMDNLDDQEGVNIGNYFPKNVTVITPDGRQILARTYAQSFAPKKLKLGQEIPLERRPSSTYLAVIALGAIESGLPAEYIASIFKFPTNGHLASTTRRQELGYPF